MKKSFFLLLLLAASLQAEVPSSVRYTLERDHQSPIVYYFSAPDRESYPILILCEGSSSKGYLGSVWYIRECFSERIERLSVGYLTVEKWGIDGNHIDEQEFWSHYTCSQRLDDHLRVMQHLEKHPPPGWNGQFILVGVSEGGALVTDLTVRFSNILATVNWVGAGDWSWADELWQWKLSSFWLRLYDAYPRWLPFSSDIPSSRQEYDALVKEIIDNPTADRSFAGMTYLYHADAFQKPRVDYSKIRSPFLVVKGTEDSDIESCDQFVQKAQKSGAPVTYHRIEGMDHWIRERPDVIDQSFEWLRNYYSRK